MQCFLSQSWLITCAIYTATWWQPSIICGLSFNLNQERWGLPDWSLRKRRGRSPIYHKAWAPFLHTLRRTVWVSVIDIFNTFILLCSSLLALHQMHALFSVNVLLKWLQCSTAPSLQQWNRVPLLFLLSFLKAEKSYLIFIAVAESEQL